MLQDIRKSTQGTAAKVIIGIIVVSFAAFGIESILLGSGGNGVAEVNGEEISPSELAQAINTQKRRLISMMGENLDPAMLEDDRLSGAALEGLINRKLLLQSVTDMGLLVSDKAVSAVITGMEQFQINGQFSPELYSSVLSSAGYSPAYFKNSLREDIAANQLRTGLAGSEFATPEELALNAKVSGEQRDLRFLTIPLASFLEGAVASDEEIQAYYEANQNSFLSQETVELDYIEMSVEDFRKPVEESVIEEAYQLETSSSEYRTENRVSHILFETGGESSEELARERIAQAQAKLAEGADFATVAAEFSDDMGSTASGGDLGFSSGDAFPQEMEDAIAALEVDSVSAPVTTDAGIHLIKVTERKEGTPPTLDELRPQLRDQLELAEARVELLRVVENLKDLVFNAESLDNPAKELSLTVKRSDAISRNQREGLFAQTSLIGAAFSEDVLEQGHNSDVVELSADSFVVLRVRKHNQPEVRSLAEVSDQIAAIIANNRALAAVSLAAEQAVQKLRAGSSVEQLATAAEYPWQVELAAQRSTTTLPAEVLQRVFEMPAPVSDESVVDYVITPAGDAQVIALVRVNEGKFGQLEPTQQLALQQQVTGEYANLVNAEYARGLRDSAEVSVR